MTHLDVLATETHFLRHLAPIWQALPAELRGTLMVSAELLAQARPMGGDVQGFASRFDLQRLLRQRPGPVLVASFGDSRRVHRLGRAVIYCEHGAGQSYSAVHSSYAGGTEARDRVVLYLVPGPHPAARDRAAYPNVPVVEIGCPKLDAWHLAAPKPCAERPVVAISFHWDCEVCPETRSAFPHFASALPVLAAMPEIQLIGHAHPRALDTLAPVYRRHGIELVPSFEEVLQRADLYVCDNSSTLFEFASLDRPVVVLNAPWYRREVEHGLRFWECADIGVPCDDPAKLPAAIRQAVKDSQAQRKRRAAAVRKVYAATDGQAAQRAVDAIVALLDRPDPVIDGLVTFRCERYPQLIVADLGVRFEQGLYRTNRVRIIEALRETSLPIVEVPA